MTTRKIEKQDWKPFFDGLSKVGGLDRKCAEIEVLGLNLGDHIASEWVPMFGVTPPCQASCRPNRFDNYKLGGGSE